MTARHYNMCAAVIFHEYMMFNVGRAVMTFIFVFRLNDIISSTNVVCSFKNIHIFRSPGCSLVGSLVFGSRATMENMFLYDNRFFSIFIFIPAWIPFLGAARWKSSKSFHPRRLSTVFYNSRRTGRFFFSIFLIVSLSRKNYPSCVIRKKISNTNRSESIQLLCSLFLFFFLSIGTDIES